MDMTGQMEKTMFSRFCRMQNLRATLNETALPPSIQSIVKAFDKEFGNNVQGTLLSDQVLGVTAQQKREMALLPEGARKLFLSRFPNYLSGSAAFPSISRLYRRLGYHGYTLAMASCVMKDSFVMFQNPQDNTRTFVGSIDLIFSLSPADEDDLCEDDIYLVVNKYSRVDAGMRSLIFRDFRSVLGQLYSSKVELTQPVLIRLCEVKGQFCKLETEYGKNVFQALPMDKVCFCQSHS